MIRDYAKIPVTSTTIDTSDWYAIRIPGMTASWVIATWLRQNEKSLVGGYRITGN